LGPFLTDIDSRAEVKGSVDPLGAMAIWTRLGRRVVGNLSTVTGSVRDFKTLVVGFALLNELRRANDSSEEFSDLSAFLRWEQLIAYARYDHGDAGFRGLRTVKRRLGESRVVPLSAERDCQILGNQKIYGLWGLFTVPARSSGLLEKEVNELTADASDFVNQLVKPSLSPMWGRLAKWISRDDRRFNLDRQAADIKRLGSVWKRHTASERDFWQLHLVKGGKHDRTEGRQLILAELLKPTIKNKSFTLSQVAIRELASRADNTCVPLAEDLRSIAACESVLAPAATVFGYLQTLDGQSAGRPVNELRKRWRPGGVRVDRERFERLRPELTQATGSEAVSGLWMAMASDLAEGRWEAVIDSMLSINKSVMESRGGAPWVADEGGTLRVRFRDDGGYLPNGSELEGLWRFPYFLESLRSVVAELAAA
jgi:hypothetical protein